MGPSRAAIIAHLTGGIFVYATVHDHALTSERQLKGEHVAVSMSRLMIRADRAGIADQVRPISRPRAEIPAVTQREWSNWQSRIQTRVCDQFCGLVANAKGTVIEQCNASIRMAHQLQRLN